MTASCLLKQYKNEEAQTSQRVCIPSIISYSHQLVLHKHSYFTAFALWCWHFSANPLLRQQEWIEEPQQSFQAAWASTLSATCFRRRYQTLLACISCETSHGDWDISFQKLLLCLTYIGAFLAIFILGSQLQDLLLQGSHSVLTAQVTYHLCIPQRKWVIKGSVCHCFLNLGPLCVQVYC